MSAIFSLDFEPKSTTDFGIDMSEFSYHKMDEKKFLSKKRFQPEESAHNLGQKDLEEIMEKSIFINLGEKDAFLTIFPMGLEPNIPNEDEVSFEDDERYCIKRKKEQRITLKAYYPGNYLFTKVQEDLLEKYLKGYNFSKVKRSAKKQKRFKHKHYIRVNIKQNFWNMHLLEALNKKLKKALFTKHFIKFPQSFVINVAKGFNKTLMNMRLIEIFRTEELFEEQKNEKDSQKLKDRKKEKDKKNKKIFAHNKAVAEEIIYNGNPELNMILNRKLRFVFEEYIYSKEFGVDEISRLRKSKNKNEDYLIAKYVDLAKKFIEFCTK